MQMWLIYACLEVLLFGASAVLAKAGSHKSREGLSTAVWSTMVFLVACVFLGQQGETLAFWRYGSHTLIFVLLAGLATAMSLLCLFRAIHLGEVIKIVPVYIANFLFVMLGRFVLFHTTYSTTRLVAAALVGVGVLCIVVKAGGKGGYGWLGWALGSSFLAAVTTLLLDYGASNLSTMNRRGVCLLLAAVITWLVAVLSGGVKALRSMSFLDGLFLCVSGLAMGLTWLMLARALGHGHNELVLAMDAMSYLMVVVLGCVFLRERLSAKGIIGLILLSVGEWMILFM